MSKMREVGGDLVYSSSAKSNCSEDDEDSLGCAINDYNRVFYDAPLIQHELNLVKEKAKKLASDEFASTCVEGSIEVGGANSSGIEEDDDTISKIEILKKRPSNTSKYYIQKDSVYFQNLITNDVDEEVNDCGIDLEFETYLNEENDLDKLVSEGSENFEKFQMEVNAKIECLEKVDFESIRDLKKMAIGKYGFVNKRFRRKAWPIMVANFSNGLKKSKKKKRVNQLPEEGTDDRFSFENITQDQIKSNKYFHQVTLDVVRTLKRFPPEISENLRFKLQNELIDLICRILVKHKHLHYYQGYHDICLTFLLVTGVEESLPLLETLTLSHLTCFMEPNMEGTLKLLFNILPLVDMINPKMAEHIQKAELGVIFCLSWLITWYSHVMDNLQIILRLYDLFMVSDPLMPVYLGAIIVSERAEEILSIDCDMASLHTVISKYPSQIENIELLESYIAKTVKLFDKYPPKSLEKLNENWLEKCKNIQIEKDRLEKEYMETREHNKALAKRKMMHVAKHGNRPKRLANRLIFGFTFTVGVAAVAMYAMNHPAKEPQELLSKVFQLLTYKDFI